MDDLTPKEEVREAFGKCAICCEGFVKDNSKYEGTGVINWHHRCAMTYNINRPEQVLPIPFEDLGMEERS